MPDPVTRKRRLPVSLPTNGDGMSVRHMPAVAMNVRHRAVKSVLTVAMSADLVARVTRSVSISATVNVLPLPNAIASSVPKRLLR